MHRGPAAWGTSTRSSTQLARRAATVTRCAPSDGVWGLYGDAPVPRDGVWGLYGDTPAPRDGVWGLYGDTPAPRDGVWGLYGDAPAPRDGVWDVRFCRYRFPPPI